MTGTLSVRARLVACGALAIGLAAASVLPLEVEALSALATLAAGAAALMTVRPAGANRVAAVAWLAALAGLAACGGLAIGGARIAAIDAGAYAGPPGARVEVRGHVLSVPRRRDGEVSVRVGTADGRLLVRVPEPVPDLPLGREVRAVGAVQPPADWEAAYLERLGVRRIVRVEAIRLTARRRGGLPALTDLIRSRAGSALERGTPEAQGTLLRGFVLGEDDRIDPRTIELFKRSGLAHLLAVSGQNVLLLALLASALLAALGVPLRPRLVVLLLAIVVYVPVAGAGPSIQRAGVMGAAGLVAALAGRPSSRAYALLAAAAVTLALDPRACSDPGWQLSFAAVAGIALATPAMRRLLGGDGRAVGASAGGALLDGAAVTLAATLATAPLLAHHFGSVSLASVPANLVALPAVAPAMWLGMLSAAAGQVSWLPVEPITWIAGLFAAYIGQVAHWFGSASWAARPLELSAVHLACAYLALAALVMLLDRGRSRRLGLRPSPARAGPLGAAVLVVLAVLSFAPGARDPQPASGLHLRVLVFDVGQGDAILLDPDPGGPILVDGGPPGADLPARLRALGVERLAAVVLTHDQLDHAGGVADVLGDLPVARLLHARAGRRLRADARSAGVAVTRIAEGSVVRSGDLRLGVLWPPRERLRAPSQDPNAESVVLAASWRGFDLLLTGDAEAELAPVRPPGSVDVLKVAHHGSADAGLSALLAEVTPALAVISAGEENPFGHPAGETLTALREAGVPLLRTDQHGDIAITAEPRGWAARTAAR